MIEIFAGRMRSGKGIGATLSARNHYIRGYTTILSNMDFFFDQPKEPVNQPLDLDIIENCVNNAIPLTTHYNVERLLVVMDEMPLLMDSRTSMSKDNRGLTYFSSQSAKDRVDIIGTTQLNDMIDIRMRKFAHWIYVCQKHYFPPFIAPSKELIRNAIEKFTFDLYDNQSIIPEYITTLELPWQEANIIGYQYSTIQKIKPRSPIKR